jgi:hypothetical protein
MVPKKMTAEDTTNDGETKELKIYKSEKEKT